MYPKCRTLGGRAEAVCFVLGPLAWATMRACGIACECAHMQGPQGDLFHSEGKSGQGRGQKWAGNGGREHWGIVAERWKPVWYPLAASL